uniref:Uncharacterized protein n=1 Tax=Serinus canaria TaxID=9135 RepID=A0A8C9L3Z2_SERCA
GENFFFLNFWEFLGGISRNFWGFFGEDFREKFGILGISRLNPVIQYQTVRYDVLPLSPISRNRLSESRTPKSGGKKPKLWGKCKNS